MKTLYIANDGKQFEDEFECIDYEFFLENPDLLKIKFYDKKSNELELSLKDKFYSEVEKVIICSQSQIEQLHKYADYTGFVSFEDIDSIGTWKYSKSEERFIKFEAKTLFAIDTKGDALDSFIEPIHESNFLDFEFYRNDIGKYKFAIETMISFPEKDGYKIWIETCLDKMNQWMIEHGFNNEKELDSYEVFTEGLNINSDFDSIADAFATLKLLVRGFKGTDIKQWVDQEHLDATYVNEKSNIERN